MDNKKLLSNTIKSIFTELRTETGQLVPFSGTGNVILTLQFKNLVIKTMELYFTNQESSLPYFSGHYRQRGSGFGALASGIGSIALPLARKIILTAAKRVGKELLLQSVPELMDVVSKKKSAKQLLKNTNSKTVKKQTGGSLALRMRQKKPNELEMV